jgi:hypothetical protein
MMKTEGGRLGGRPLPGRVLKKRQNRTCMSGQSINKVFVFSEFVAKCITKTGQPWPVPSP